LEEKESKGNRGSKESSKDKLFTTLQMVALIKEQLI
jgi:hypothetical protein